MSERPSEFELISRYFAPWAGEGAFGLLDDAATIKVAPGNDLVVTKDLLVAGVHFFADDPPDLVARKALRVNLSDLAAKGAHPRGFLLGLGLANSWSQDWLVCFAEGLGSDSRHFDCPLLGGDTVKTPGPLMISITAFGEVPAGQMVRRTGARPGDAILVTGTIGDAALGLRARLQPDAPWLEQLQPEDRAHLAARYLLPQPRTPLAGFVGQYASTAMDISDGFVGDLRKMMAEAGATIDLDAIPLSTAARVALSLDPALSEVALTGGDDYELLLTLPASHVDHFLAEAQRIGQLVTRIGSVDTSAVVTFVDLDGSDRQFSNGSFVHF